MSEFITDGPLSVSALDAFVSANTNQNPSSNKNIKNLISTMQNNGFELPLGDFNDPHALSETYSAEAPSSNLGIKYGSATFFVASSRCSSSMVNANDAAFLNSDAHFLMATPTELNEEDISGGNPGLPITYSRYPFDVYYEEGDEIPEGSEVGDYKDTVHSDNRYLFAATVSTTNYLPQGIFSKANVLEDWESDSGTLDVDLDTTHLAIPNKILTVSFGNAYTSFRTKPGTEYTLMFHWATQVGGSELYIDIGSNPYNGSVTSRTYNIYNDNLTLPHLLYFSFTAQNSITHLAFSSNANSWGISNVNVFDSEELYRNDFRGTSDTFPGGLLQVDFENYAPEHLVYNSIIANVPMPRTNREDGNCKRPVYTRFESIGFGASIYPHVNENLEIYYEVFDRGIFFDQEVLGIYGEPIDHAGYNMVHKISFLVPLRNILDTDNIVSGGIDGRPVVVSLTEYPIIFYNFESIDYRMRHRDTTTPGTNDYGTVVTEGTWDIGDVEGGHLFNTKATALKFHKTIPFVNHEPDPDNPDNILSTWSIYDAENRTTIQDNIATRDEAIAAWKLYQSQNNHYLQNSLQHAHQLTLYGEFISSFDWVHTICGVTHADCAQTHWRLIVNNELYDFQNFYMINSTQSTAMQNADWDGYFDENPWDLSLTSRFPGTNIIPDSKNNTYTTWTQQSLSDLVFDGWYFWQSSRLINSNGTLGLLHTAAFDPYQCPTTNAFDSVTGNCYASPSDVVADFTMYGFFQANLSQSTFDAKLYVDISAPNGWHENGFYTTLPDAGDAHIFIQIIDYSDFSTVYSAGYTAKYRGTLSTTLSTTINLKSRTKYFIWIEHDCPQLSTNPEPKFYIDNLSLIKTSYPGQIVYPYGTPFPEESSSNAGLEVQKNMLVDLSPKLESQLDLAIDKYKQIIKNNYSQVLHVTHEPSEIGGTLAAAGIIRNTSKSGLQKGSSTVTQELMDGNWQTYGTANFTYNASTKTISVRKTINTEGYIYKKINVTPIMQGRIMKISFDSHSGEHGQLTSQVDEDLTDSEFENHYGSYDSFGAIDTHLRLEIPESDYTLTNGYMHNFESYVQIPNKYGLEVRIYPYGSSYTVFNNLSLLFYPAADRVNAMRMYLDIADLGNTESLTNMHDNKSAAYYICLHEMMHGAGLIGSFLSRYNLVTDAGFPTQYIGEKGVYEYQQIVTQKVAEFGLNINDFEIGSAPWSAGSAHIAEYAKEIAGKTQPTFANELMTPLYDFKRGILSKFTIGLLDDLGYDVDYSQSESIDLLELTMDTSISQNPSDPSYDLLVRKQSKIRRCSCGHKEHAEQIDN